LTEQAFAPDLELPLAHGPTHQLCDDGTFVLITEGFIERRTLYAGMYNCAFAGMEEVALPPDRPGSRHAWHLYILRLNLQRLNIDRSEFIRELRRKGIGTSVHFIPIPLLQFFAQIPLAEAKCPRALGLYPRIISLPLYPAMTEEEVHYVAQCVVDILQRARKVRFVAPGAPAAAALRAIEASGPSQRDL